MPYKSFKWRNYFIRATIELIVPKKVKKEEYEKILNALDKNPNGVSIRDLMKAELGYPKRTLQRRIDHLIVAGRIVATGGGRSRKYFTPKYHESQLPRVTSPDASWLSEKGLALKKMVMRPISIRTPVSYQTEFLDAYEPNRTRYLPQRLSHTLAEMGSIGAGELPAGTYLRQIMGRLVIDLSWNSSRLEGNTYSLLETERLLELGESADGKNAEETQMILNHKSAIELLADEAGGIAFNRYTICNLHAVLSENLLPDPSSGGRLRSKLIGIGQSVYEPLQVPQQIEMYFDRMLTKAEAIQNPFEQSFFIMVHLPYLQPFEDVNKRVSRLAANIPMIRKNLCPLSFVDVDQDDYIRGMLAVYELNRIEYLRDVYAWAYQRSCARYSAVRQSLGEPDPFRLRYRLKITAFIQEIIRGVMDKQAATKWIPQKMIEEIELPERARFREVIESELRGLHEGNIGRYKIRPLEFARWKAGW